MTTRRSFLSNATALAVAPFISTSVTRALADASRKRVGFALCGLGSLSTHQIAPALAKSKNCRLAGIISGTPAKAARWQAQYQIHERNTYSYENMHQIVDNDDIDVVYVVTPNALHLDHAMIAAKAGKHVLCEKPMEISADRCQQMIDVVRAAGRLLAIGYRCRFEPHHLECARIAHAREFGALKIIDAHFGFDIEPGVWRLNRALAGGGPLMDVGIYALQATRYLTGEEPAWVSATTTTGDPVRFSQVEESVLWQAKFPGGAVSHCGSTYSGAPTGYFRAIAEHGWFGLDPAFNYNGVRGLRSDGRSIDQPDVDQFAAEMDDFAECIVSGKKSKVSGEEGLRDVRIMMAIYESARLGKPVELHAARSA